MYLETALQSIDKMPQSIFDEIDYQILVEADFLVNIMEDGLSKEAALKAYESIFKTTCGKMICREMFDFCS